MVSRKQIPNTLTIARLFLAAGLFVLLSFYRFGAGSPTWLLPVAIVVFIVAAVTDALDGHLARKWQVVSTFGRIVDPFADKILILGALVYLCSGRFVAPSDSGLGMATGLYAWMVVVILSRELLVTGIRGELEGMGLKFPANWWGKIKMILQSIIVPILLLIVWMLDGDAEGRYAWLLWPRDVLVYATVLVTVISGVPYVTGAMAALKQGRVKE